MDSAIQTTFTSKVSQVDFGDCGPSQQPRSNRFRRLSERGSDGCSSHRPGMAEKMSITVPELTLAPATALASSLALKATENPTAPNMGTSECESPTAMQVDKSMSRRRQCSTTKSRLSYLSKCRATLPVKRPSGPS